MKGTCQNCSVEFEYRPSQSSGKYCSNKCQQYKQRETKVQSGKADVKSISKYLIERDIYECVMCGNDGSWCGKPLPLQLDHIDGDRKNNDLDNLRWLCPNCHTQTDTWGSGNVSKEGRKRQSAGAIKRNTTPT